MHKKSGAKTGRKETKTEKWIETVRPYSLEPNEGRSYVKKLFITPSFQALSPELLEKVSKRINLAPLPHQRITVEVMLEIETQQKCSVKLFGSDANGLSNPIAETRAGILSERAGSGKTLEILMIIALNPRPALRPEITAFSIPRGYINKGRLKEGDFSNWGFATEVRKTYKKLLRPTLIFVGKSVLAQWMETIREYTDFSVLMIDNVFALRDFYNVWKKSPKKLQKYDIILVKNGNVAGKFDAEELNGSGMEFIKSKPIISVFGELFKKVCWPRVVLDDFDNLSIPNTAKIIPALFTWLVSATRRKPPGRRLATDHKGNLDMLCNYRPCYNWMWFNRELYTFFNVGCENDFINASTEASLVHYYVHKFSNPHDWCIGLIGAMKTTETNEIAEMLNGDAIQMAMNAVGMKKTETASTVAVFERILDKNWATYKKSVNIGKYISRVKDWLRGMPAEGGTGISTNALESFKRNLKRPGPLAEVRKLITHNQDAITNVVEEVGTENDETKENSSKAIQRVRDNINDDECPILCTPFSEAGGIVIMKCCGMVISVEAARRCYPPGDKKVVNCAKCRHPTSFSDLIYVDRNIDSLLTDDNIPDENIPDENIPEEQNAGPKYNCIISIIRGNVSDKEDGEKEDGGKKDGEKEDGGKKDGEKEDGGKKDGGKKDGEKELRGELRDDIKIHNLLEGNVDKGEAAIENKKVLIFANYRETMKLVEEKLIKCVIPYLKIQGSPVQIKDAVDRYFLPNDDPESINVLLVNGAKYCAGLNLQITTDLIFTGKIADSHIEQQLAGRCCRIGRTNNLDIHYVLYENECVTLNAKIESVEGEKDGN